MREPLHSSEFLAALKRIPELDAERAMEEIGGSEDLYKKMLLQFTRLLPSNLKDMDSALRADQWDMFAVKAHGIKGSLRQIGNPHLAREGEALELAAKSNNPSYCHARYPDFKDGLLCFCAGLRAAFEHIREGAGTAAERGIEGDIRAYGEPLAQVRAALEDFDSILAAEMLAPLTKVRFGPPVDALLAGAEEALASFQPQKALAYIVKILD